MHDHEVMKVFVNLGIKQFLVKFELIKMFQLIKQLQFKQVIPQICRLGFHWNFKIFYDSIVHCAQTT